MHIPKEILKNFEEIITQKRQTKSDFDLIYADKSSSPHLDDPNAQYVSKGELLITKKSTNKKKLYQTGHGCLWEYEFEMDLRNDYFE